MLIAYAALWLLVFGYLFVIMRRQKAVSEDIEELSQRFDRGGAP